MATRWGILSAGKISYDFTAALSCQNAEEHRVVAVAARSHDRAKEFAKEFNIKSAYGSYEELVKDPNVDIVYIGAIHPEHHKLSLLCLNAGKNVLCEKPVTMTLAAAKEVFALAKEKKLFFMEGYWSCFFPVFKRLREELLNIGDVVNMQCSLCIDIFDVSRLNQKHLGGGTLLDIGCYCVMVSDLVFGERPLKIQAEGQISEEGVDSGGAVTLRFSGDRLSSFVYSARTTTASNCLVVNGTKGSIKIEDPFWNPTCITGPSGKFTCPLPQCGSYKFNFHHSEGFMYEQQCVRDCLIKKELQCPLMTHSSSENILFTLEQILQEIGVHYDFPYTV